MPEKSNKSGIIAAWVLLIAIILVMSWVGSASRSGSDTGVAIVVLLNQSGLKLADVRLDLYSDDAGPELRAFGELPAGESITVKGGRSGIFVNAVEFSLRGKPIRTGLEYKPVGGEILELTIGPTGKIQTAARQMPAAD